MQAPSEMAEQHSICWQKNKIMLVRKHHLHIYSGSRERPFTLGFYSKEHIMCLSIWKKGLTPLNKQTWNRKAWPKEYHAWFHVKVGCFHCGWGYGVSLKQHNSGPEESLWDSQLVSIPDSFPHLCHWSDSLSRSFWRDPLAPPFLAQKVISLLYSHDVCMASLVSMSVPNRWGSILFLKSGFQRNIIGE